MQTILLGVSELHGSRLAYGCWRLAGPGKAREASAERLDAGRRAVMAAYEAGFTLFDHADVYCDGVAEEIFGQVLQDVQGMREWIVIGTKCGIRMAGEPAGAPYRYDFSAEYIIESCEKSLQRLGVETIDIYQLHRPDWLADWEEVAEAFMRLREQGKVREFGVSNFRPAQVAALQKELAAPLIVNQVEISLTNYSSFEDGTLDQCQAFRITPLAWSPLGGGTLAGAPGSSSGNTPLEVVLDRYAEDRGVSRSVIALAWLLRHPAKIVPIVGSTNPDRILDAAGAVDVELSREDWYTLLEAARGSRLP
jgi:predicted oxidoreductase